MDKLREAAGNLIEFVEDMYTWLRDIKWLLIITASVLIGVIGVSYFLGPSHRFSAPDIVAIRAAREAEVHKHGYDAAELGVPAEANPEDGSWKKVWLDGWMSKKREPLSKKEE